MIRLIQAAKEITSNDRFSEAAEFVSIPVNPADPTGIYAHEGHVARVILITEGLGNRRNMNYYSSDAIMTAPRIFEGKSCYLNHPSESEERDIPERRVQDKCGYFKNCRVETVDGLTACTGELHFDLSEAGRQAFDKACTALHYKSEFPGLDAEYVGLSIHADGDWDDRTIRYEGETLDVKYVTKFTDAVSCDLVTSPARGGRILALVESAAGAIRHEGAIEKQPKEVDQMKDPLNKLMEAARSALRKADEEKDPAKKAELISEAHKLNEKFLSEASKAAHTQGDPKEEKPKESEETPPAEDPAPVEAKESKKKEMDKCADDAEESDDDEDFPPKSKKKAKKKDDDEDADKVEANRIAVASLLKESGIIVGAKRLERLSKLSLREAKDEIDMLAEDQKSIVKGVLKEMRVPPVAHAKATESERDGDGESNNSLFADCFR